MGNSEFLLVKFREDKIRKDPEVTTIATTLWEVFSRRRRLYVKISPRNQRTICAFSFL